MLELAVAEALALRNFLKKYFFLSLIDSILEILFKVLDYFISLLQYGIMTFDRVVFAHVHEVIAQVVRFECLDTLSMHATMLFIPAEVASGGHFGH